MRAACAFHIHPATRDCPNPTPPPPRPRSQQWRQESFHKKTWASEIFHFFHCLKNCTYRLWPTFELSRIRRLLFFSFVFLGYLLLGPWAGLFWNFCKRISKHVSQFWFVVMMDVLKREIFMPGGSSLAQAGHVSESNHRASLTDHPACEKGENVSHSVVSDSLCPYGL